jgi:hypothetical protein
MKEELGSGKQCSYQQVKKFLGYESHRMKGENMRIVTMTVILGLPLVALDQQPEPQQTQG